MLKEIYKTKFLAYQGVVIAISLVVAVTFSYLVIPEFKGISPAEQIYSVKGEALKYNDKGIITDFFNSIKHNNGYLVLGTSESGELPDGNYYDYLNQDDEIKIKFSKLSGAGRTCGIYFPIFLNHANELKGLKIIYLINPVYWGSNLCKPEFDYWTRYVDYDQALKAAKKTDTPASVREIIKEYQATLNTPNRALHALISVVRKTHAKFKRDLNFMVNPADYTTNLQQFPYTNSTANFWNYGQMDTASIDTLWNVKKDFMPHKRMSAINQDIDFRYRELEAFVELSKMVESDIIFLMCPANEIFIEQFDPLALPTYQTTNSKIKDLLNSHSAKVIDATSIGCETGTFIDNQHISSYGAYLIYKKIKSHLHETEALETK